MELQVLEQNVIVQAFATQGGSLLLVDRIAFNIDHIISGGHAFHFFCQVD